MLDRLKSPEKDSNGNPYIQEIETLADFRRVITEADDNQKLVVACFYSPWCRACRALAPGFTALAKRNGGMTFIQVPATEKNANLHNGLGVPSVPYVQVYHPQAGLVESQKLIRFLLPGFQKVLKDYELGSCSLVHDKSGEWSTSNPNERSKG